MVAIILIYLCQPLQIDLRTMLDNAYKSESARNEMLTHLQQIAEPSALEKAYLGTVYMLLADDAFLPWNKYKNFKSGVDLLDEASEMEPQQLEVRYLRFACQTHAPTFLGYNDSLVSDKSALLNNFSKLTDLDLKKRISKLLLESAHVTLQEKERVKR